jgi:hypothetical protein
MVRNKGTYERKHEVASSIGCEEFFKDESFS